MYNIDFRPLLIAIFVIALPIGWALIEAVLWVFSHIALDWK